MTTSRDEQDPIRLYLLGKLAGDAREEFERQLFAEDDDLIEELLAVEEEMIDDFLTGDLSTDEAAMFEKNFLVTDKRRQKLRLGKAFRTYAQQASAVPAKPVKAVPPKAIPSPTPWNWQQLFSSSLVRGAAFAAVLLIAAIGIWRIFFYESDVDKGLVALNNAYRERRSIEARFTEQSYAPFWVTRGHDTEHVDSLSLRRAERYADDAVADNVGPAANHLLGKVFLAKRDFDKAINELERAAKKDPLNAEVYSDLGAALLEKGKIEKDKTEANEHRSDSGEGVEYLARSIESLKKALELNPNLLEALFNRALAFEANNLLSLAEADWREYLKKDATSKWAQEARQKLKLIEDRRKGSTTPEQSLNTFLSAHDAGNEDLAWQIISQNHTSAGNLICNSLLDAYLKSTLRPNEQAPQMLQALSYVGALMMRRSDDHYVSDLVDFYRSIEPEKLPLLVEAHREMERGYQLFSKSQFSKAIASYSRAKRMYDSVGNIPEAIFATYRIGHCYVLQPNSKRGLLIFEGLFSIVEQKQFRWLLAQCLYQMANLQVGLSEYSKAIELSNQALTIEESLNDSNGVVKSLIQLADAYCSLNNKRRSLSFLERSLIAVGNDSLEAIQAWQTYIAISLNMGSFNFSSAALEFQKEALRLAIQIDRPLIKSRSYQYLGLTCANLKLFDEARKYVEQAIEIGQTLHNEPNGVEIVANALVQLGDIYQQVGNHSDAIVAYDRSLRLYKELNFSYFSYAAHKGKLQSFILQGDDKSTEEEIQVVLELFKQFREKIIEQSQRNTFFDAQQYIYDLAIDFESRRGNFDRAFDYSESSRARSLRDLIQRGGQIIENPVPELSSLSSEPMRFSELKATLPQSTSIIQYAVLPNKVLIWVINRNETLTTQEIPLASEELSEKIRIYRDAIEGKGSVSDEEVSEQARALFKILVEPVEHSLTRTNVCIVADKVLHYVPFASLVSPKSGNYFIEDHRLLLSPSSSLFLDYSRIAQAKGSSDERILSVGDPTFDREAFPTLQSLTAARHEAEQISYFYNPQTRRVLLGNKATKRLVETEALQANVIHFAAHYIADEQSELRSKLILAAERDSASGRKGLISELQAAEIYTMDFVRTRLVVLSGCQTGLELQYKGEGAIGFARPFMARGVPLVIASLWSIDSEATAELMINFHRHRRRDRLPTAEALRQAQLDMLQSENATYRKPYSWASFVAIGGDTSF